MLKMFLKIPFSANLSLYLFTLPCHIKGWKSSDMTYFSFISFTSETSAILTWVYRLCYLLYIVLYVIYNFVFCIVPFKEDS